MTNKTMEFQTVDEAVGLEMDLINGMYGSEEAFEVTQQLLLEKINFLEMKKFSQEIRFGQVEQHILDRLKELNAASKEIGEFMKQNTDPEARFKIISKISINKI